MSLIWSTALAVAAAAQPAAAPVRADDPGLVGGWIPGDAPLDPLIAAVVAATPGQRPLAIDALVRAMLARGYDLGAMLPRLCVDCGETAPSPALLRLAPLIDNDRLAIEITAGISAASALQEAQAEPAAGTGAAAAVRRYNLGVLRAMTGEFAGALPLQRAAVASLSSRLPTTDTRLWTMKLGLARTLIGLNEIGEARAQIDAVAALTTADSRAMADVQAMRARLFERMARPGDAASAIEAAIRIGDADRARRAAQPLPVAALTAMIAALKRDGAIDDDTAATLAAAIAADPQRSGPLAVADGERRAMLARLLLARGDIAAGAAMARAATAMAPDSGEATLALALADLRSGPVSADRLVEIENVFDRLSWGPGRGEPWMIEGRVTLARMARDAEPSRAWVHMRQGSDAARDWLHSTTGADTAAASLAYRTAFLETIRVAWRASELPPPVWDPDARQFTIFFDTDSYNLTASAEVVIAAAIAAHRRLGGRITIEGHLDEYGTREYLISLGDRLASSAQQRLEALGVDRMKISRISFGKERPIERPGVVLRDRIQRRAVIVIQPEG